VRLQPEMNFVWVLGIETIDVMIVDGHVGKVFCRTGLLEEVLYEKRPYNIQASNLYKK